MKSLAENEGRLWVIVNTIRQMLRGRTNATGSFSLTNSTTTTTVTDEKVNTDDCVLLMPLTAAAAADGAWVSAVAKGSFTVTHTSATTARTFRYLVAGG